MREVDAQHVLGEALGCTDDQAFDGYLMEEAELELTELHGSAEHGGALRLDESAKLLVVKDHSANPQAEDGEADDENRQPDEEKQAATDPTPRTSTPRRRRVVAGCRIAHWVALGR